MARYECMFQRVLTLTVSFDFTATDDTSDDRADQLIERYMSESGIVWNIEDKRKGEKIEMHVTEDSDEVADVTVEKLD